MNKFMDICISLGKRMLLQIKARWRFGSSFCSERAQFMNQASHLDLAAITIVALSIVALPLCFRDLMVHIKVYFYSREFIFSVCTFTVEARAYGKQQTHFRMRCLRCRLLNVNLSVIVRSSSCFCSTSPCCFMSSGLCSACDFLTCFHSYLHWNTF